MRILLTGVLVLASFSVNADETSKDKCIEIYQAWVFNMVLEDVCEIGGVASRKIGMMAKSLCDDVLTEEDRNKYSLEVASAFKQDILKMGKENLCEIEVPRYYKMLETLYE